MYYKEYAHAAGEPDDDEYKTNMPEVDIGDNGKLDKSPDGGASSSECKLGKSPNGVASSSAPPEELTHVGTTWSQTGDVWWKPATDEHHVYEYHEHDEHDNGYYDDYDDYDDYDQNEEDDTFFIY